MSLVILHKKSFSKLFNDHLTKTHSHSNCSMRTTRVTCDTCCVGGRGVRNEEMSHNPSCAKVKLQCWSDFENQCYLFAETNSFCQNVL